MVLPSRSQLGQLRWLLCLQNGLYKSGAGVPVSRPSSNPYRYVFVAEHVASSALLMGGNFH